MPKLYDNKDKQYVKRQGYHMTGSSYEELYLQDGEGIFDNIKALLFGRKDLPPNARNVLKKNGNDQIAYIQVARNPLSTFTKLGMDAISLGDFSRKAKKLPYDKLFHLYMIVTLKNGKNILIEKNDVINMEYRGVRKNAESKRVAVNKSLTLNTMMANTKKYMGKKFLPYSGFNNNCQDFLMAIMKSNGLGNSDTYKFVKQHTTSIFKGNPTFRKVTDFITDLGAKFDIIKQGAGNEQQSI